MDIASKYLSGDKLYGDDFNSAEIATWFKEEEYGYYYLGKANAKLSEPSEYGYHAFNRHHAYNLLEREHFATCLAFGCAKGDDVLPVAHKVGRFIAVEPAEEWWSDSIGNTRADYRKPNIDGQIDMPDQSVDLIVCLGVLHHIPNVTKVISEFARVLAPGGVLIIREPIHSMGDWSKPRNGLTKNERGIPMHLLSRQINSQGLSIRSFRPCMFSLTYRLRLIVRRPFDNRFAVLLDHVASMLFAWNNKYNRTSLIDKVAPTSVFIVAEKPS
jgi:SAM-dependent methyltransferase